MTDDKFSALYDQAMTGKLNRRQVLKRAAALGLSAPAIAALLAACGGSEETPAPTTAPAATETQGSGGSAATATSAATGTAEATPTQASGGGTRGEGGLVRLLWWQAPTILNGHLAQGTKDFDASSIVLEPLADIDINGQLIPKLAAEIPSLDNGGVAPDGMSVTWKLKEGVVWSDGQPFTSKDVKFTYEYVIDEGTTATTVGNYMIIDSIETPDDHTVTINFKEPTPGWFNVFVGPYGQIVPEHVLKDYVGDAARNAPFNLKPIGTGPYVVQEFKPGDVVEYVANENYREEGKPYFGQVSMKGGGDAASAARAAIQTGEVDYAWNLQVEDAVLKSLEAGGKGEVFVGQGPGVERILINMTDPNIEVDGERSHISTKHPFQSDLQVRKAYNVAIQRDVIADTLYGRGGTATANILTGPLKFVSPNTSWKYDPDEAARLLDEAGWVLGSDGVREKDGVKMVVTYNTTVNQVRQKTQEIVKADFEKLGIKVELRSTDAGVFFSSDAGNPDTAAHFYCDLEMFTNNPASIYPLDYMLSWYGPEVAQKSNNWAGSNYERWQNEEYDRLYEAALTELDEAKQVELVVGMNDLVIENVVVIPLVSRNDVRGKAKDLDGINYSPWASSADLWNIQNWTRKA